MFLFVLQVCAKGYFLSEQSVCLPCNCKGHADYCNDITGVCINCRNHSTGDFCEMCEDGYILSSSQDGQHACIPCSCPLPTESNNFAVYCKKGVGSLQCKCKQGYAGNHCERCAPGYYGNPMLIGSSCKRCDCNGNTDPNLIFNECHNMTGRCQHCWGNTAGDNCERCAPGFYGDAISAKNCKECKCNKCGTSSCDDRTGVCHCKPGVKGRFCDQCEEGYFGFSSCQGCRRCECGPASLRSTCHPLTHSCSCRPGAGGRYCERCLPGYWDYSPSGCQKCDCESGHCNMHTGECLAEAAVNLCNNSCDDCIWQLIGDLRLSNKTLDQLKVGVLNISTGAAANDRIKYYNYTAHQLQVGKILLCVSVCVSTDMIHDWELYNIQQDMDPEEVRRSTEMAQEMISWIRQLDLSTQEPIARNEATKAHELLARIRQMEKKLMITENRLPSIREILSRFSSRLSEAEKFLLDAAGTVQEAEDKNKASLLKFQRKEEKQQRLTEDQLAVNDTLETSRVFISEAERTVAEVDALTQVRYHAEIDGADQRLTEKMERLSLADRDLVQKADDHAAELETQANELEEDLKESDANGFVQRAISAANVYNNIVKYIDDANITSLTTLNSSQRAEDVRLSDTNQYSPSRLFHIQAPESPQSYLLLCLYPVLLTVVPLIFPINLQPFTDRTPQRLNFSLEVAEETLIRSTEVLKTITPISERVQQWSQNMRNSEYSTAAYEKAVLSAGEAVENLNVLVPELLDKLKVVEEKKPVNNVTTNIMRIRELIAQARSVAKKVQVSVKFNGQSSVEVQPPSNLEELKTSTSISLFMRVDPDKDPIEDRFILYLGDRNGKKDYMGLAIKNDKLVFVYNLGRDDVEIPLSSKPVSQWPAVFNYIKIERLGRHGKIYLTIPSQGSTDEQKFIQKGNAPITDSLFDIDPKNVAFFIGGAPPDVKLPPPLTLAPFVGCIELASINNDVISLYNFKETHLKNVSPPCPRYKLAFSQSRIASYLFDGTGYALISNIERRAKFGPVIRFDISVRTVTDNCAIFLMVSGENFFLLEIKNGFPRLTYDFGFSDGPKLLDTNLPKFQINDAKYHEVSVIYHQLKKVILLVDKALVKTVENPRTPLPFSEIYIGGAPSSLLKSRAELSAVVGLKGCVKGFMFQKRDFNLLEEPGTIGISSGCPEESVVSTQLTHLHEHIYFNFMQPEEFSIALENGAVVLNNRGVKVKLQKKQYNDGRTHFLLASVNKERYSLLLDDKDKQEKKRPASAMKSSSDSPVKTFYYGGSPSSSLRNFTGCISHAYINRQDRDIEAEDFQKYTEKVNVSLQDCPAQQPPAALMSPHRATSKAKQSQKVARDKSSHLLEPTSSDQKSPEPSIQSCYLSPSPRSTHQAFSYGGVANSRQHYAGVPASLPERCHLSLSLKIQSASGLIFYVSDEQEDNFMALFLVEGKLVFSFNVGDQKILPAYVNFLVHTVFEDRAQADNVVWKVSDFLFVGGVPPGRAQRNIKRNSAHSFTGCMKNLQLDGRHLSSAAETFGVSPCFEGLKEDGTYFSEEGGYVVMDESFELGLRFELVMEVRPRVASAVLLHVRVAEGYFIMYIHQGAVVVVVNDGTHEFSTKVSPRQGVCDGTWHSITVIRDANVLQLDVDSEIQHVVGPVNPRSADTKRPVFIGGAPDLFLPESVATRRPYVGCMKNLTINKNPVSFSKAVLVSGAVGVGSCPAA
uniref:Laminin subunit alpha 4 n=1 Tax=Cyprinodon variegatus TaxID=28743 RepID=A0A3Q2CDJ9_CYPVA